MSPPTDNIPSPRKRADFPQVFRHERTLANRLRETNHGSTAPPPERCPRQEPLGRNGPSAFTLCHRAGGPCRAPFALPGQGGRKGPSTFPWYRRVGGPIQSLVPESGWPHPIPGSQPRWAFQSCANSERLHSGRGGVAESKIQPLLRDQCLAGQFGPLRQNVRAIPRAVLAWLAAHGFQPDLVCKSHWTAGKLGVRAHGAWGHEVLERHS